jgi:hypothetical protein
MALVCKNISKIKQFFSCSLSSHLEKIKIENVLNVLKTDLESNHKIRLNHYLSLYNNLKNSNLEVETIVKPKLIELEAQLEERIINSLESYENFGQDSLISTLQSKYNKNSVNFFINSILKNDFTYIYYFDFFILLNSNQQILYEEPNCKIQRSYNQNT